MLQSFRKEDGPILVLVATIAFGMSVDCKGVHRTIHFGPSKNVEAFMQETGRAGRDGEPRISYLLYKGLQLNHVEKNIKEYRKKKECRRKTLLKHFRSENFTASDPVRNFCDNCASRCNCNTADCSNYTLFVVNSKTTTESLVQNKREVNDLQKKEVEKALIKYRKSLVIGLIGKSAHGQLASLTNINTLLGFSELQIEQVVSNCEQIFSLEDVMRTVEIWDTCHAKKILDVLGKDIATSNDNQAKGEINDGDQLLDDDELLGEWAVLAEDDELLNMMANSFSISEMDSTLSGNSAVNGLF